MWCLFLLSRRASDGEYQAALTGTVLPLKRAGAPTSSFANGSAELCDFFLLLRTPRGPDDPLLPAREAGQGPDGAFAPLGLNDERGQRTLLCLDLAAEKRWSRTRTKHDGLASTGPRELIISCKGILN